MLLYLRGSFFQACWEINPARPLLLIALRGDLFGVRSAEGITRLAEATAAEVA
jgi:hypothetical protein|uniref:Uncharacterized protein n=1 Tax=Picea glauca TaxID=3330 RepID=A0A101M1Y5_PICGL|nr:hypothetical protein ABT39_MTgene2734 [Picea glauca]